MSVSVLTNFEPFLSLDDVLSGVALESAEIVETKIVELMKEPKSGNPYKHIDGSIRPASAEGEAPGINSEDLIGSFDVIALSSLEAQINSDVEHGTILQEKRNRPFTDPAIERAMPEIEDLIGDRVEERWR